jgi:predicted pyridoxine 5'-phosphate oxidase superfamily flavin-nucleotide-binding protein
MAYHYGSLLFTTAVQAWQERYGSRRAYAKLSAASGETSDRLGPHESEFLAARDSFYIASISASGWPYVQHRGGPRGFLKIIDDRTLAFADFRGNKQYISTGNVTTDPRVALILVDYPDQMRLKVLGRAEVLAGADATAWLPKVSDPTYQATIERVFVILIEAFDWNCPQHITPRFTEGELRGLLAPVEDRMRELERENERLREELAVAKRDLLVR